MFDYSDPANASLELNRRGQEIFIKKTKKFYPELTKETLKDQWKEHLSVDMLRTGKNFIKKSLNWGIEFL